MSSKYPVAAIAAMAKNRTIGVSNDLPWDYPEDMNFFREKTKKSVMIMGRKTFDSFGGKPLPGRFHIVITRKPQASEFKNVIYVATIEEALVMAQATAPKYENSEVFLIGGAEIYRMGLQDCDRIYLTVINRDFKGDAYFPEFSMDQWKLTKSLQSALTPELVFQVWDQAAKAPLS